MFVWDYHCGFEVLPDEPLRPLLQPWLDANVSWLADEPSAAKPGDYAELEAVVYILLVFSACPSTVGQISGGQTKGVTVEIA